MKVISPGVIVQSKMGRDKNRLFLVIKAIDNDFIEYVDGDLRGIDRPKKKRVRHVRYIKTLPEVQLRLNNNLSLSNHEIREWLKIEEV